MTIAPAYDLPLVAVPSVPYGDPVPINAGPLALSPHSRDHLESFIGDYNRIGKSARFFDPQPRRPDIAKWTDGDK
jgi:hypothetical protein